MCVLEIPKYLPGTVNYMIYADDLKLYVSIMTHDDLLKMQSASKASRYFAMKMK